MCMRCFMQADETLASLPPSLEFLQLALQTPIEVLAFCMTFHAANTIIIIMP